MGSVTKNAKEAQELCDKSYIDLAKQSEEVKNFDAQIADAEKAFKEKESTLTALASIDSTDQPIVTLKDTYLAETSELKDTISGLKSKRDTSYNLFVNSSQLYTSLAPFCSPKTTNDPQQLLNSVSSTTPTSTPPATPTGATTPTPTPAPAPTPPTPPAGPSDGDDAVAAAQTSPAPAAASVSIDDSAEFKKAKTQVRALLVELNNLNTRHDALDPNQDSRKQGEISDQIARIHQNFTDDSSEAFYLRHALFVQVVEDVLGSSKALEDYKIAMIAQTNITVKFDIDDQGQYSIEVTLSHPNGRFEIDQKLEELITQSLDEALSTKLTLLMKANASNDSYSIVNFPIIQ